MDRLPIDGAVIEYQVQGSGEPVLLIPPSVIIDGLGFPLLAQPELASRYQLIHYHRRGYSGSSLGTEPPTIARGASDASSLLKHLEVKTAHIVGHSFGGNIALQLALDEPDLVHSLALLEPALNMASSGNTGMDRVVPMLKAYQSGNKRAAVEAFCDAVFGPSWQIIVEHAIPGSIEQAVKDVDTFVKELSAFQEWQFGPTEAAVIRQPVLSVLGVRSSPFMKKGRELLHSWVPQTEDFDAQTTHLLQMQDPEGVACALAEFFSCHPIA